MNSPRNVKLPPWLGQDLNTKQYLNQFQRDICNCFGSLLLEL